MNTELLGLVEDPAALRLAIRALRKEEAIRQDRVRNACLGLIFDALTFTEELPRASDVTLRDALVQALAETVTIASAVRVKHLLEFGGFDSMPPALSEVLRA